MAPTAGLPRRRHRTRSWVNRLVWMAVFLGGATAVVTGWRWLASKVKEETAPAGTIVQFPKLNCQFIKPGPPWEEEESASIQRGLRPELILRRTSPSAWLALLIKDYKDHTPPDDEVRQEALRRMGNYFNKESLELEQAADATLAQLRAQRLLFRGEVENQPISGECLILTHQGLAYWLLAWAPADQAGKVQGELDSLPKRFALAKDRKEWKEKPAHVQVFRGSQIPYVLQDADGLWQQWTPATDYDPKAVLALVARERPKPGKEEDQPAKSTASIVVLILGQSTTSLETAGKAARFYLEAQQKTLYPQTKIETLRDWKNPEKADRIGSAPGRLMPLQVTNGENRQRFVLLGVVREPNQVLVLQCECAWESRALWELEFMKLLRTFRLGKDQAATNQGGGEVRPSGGSASAGTFGSGAAALPAPRLMPRLRRFWASLRSSLVFTCRFGSSL